MPPSKDWEEFLEDSVSAEEAVEAADPMDESPAALSDPEESPSPEAEDARVMSVEELQTALHEAQAHATENWDKYLRAVSDVDNMRRRAERDVENAHKYALEKFTQELIPVIDSLEQATESSSMSPEQVEGVQLTYKMFIDVLEKFSVTQLNPVGEPFDPNQHEAVSMVVSPDAKPGTVVSVFQRGYMLNQRVVRAARVVVAKAE